ncbi:MAG: hypothetical protein GF408_00080 [Candidatus Omnitrophica bacterium]|nr:hypothetical protein [Candidatus Omnitrophota bacterium]
MSGFFRAGFIRAAKRRRTPSSAYRKKGVIVLRGNKMRTTLVVDGYNAINAIPEAKKEMRKSLLAARKAISEMCRRYARSSGYITDLKIVFDGQDKYRNRNRLFSGGKEQLFSPTGCGDEKIIQTVKKACAEGKVVLASNDNYVRNNARAYGAKPIRAEELAGRKRQTRKAGPKGKFHGIASRKLAEITREYREYLGL